MGIERGDADPGNALAEAPHQLDRVKGGGSNLGRRDRPRDEGDRQMGGDQRNDELVGPKGHHHLGAPSRWRGARCDRERSLALPPEAAMACLETGPVTSARASPDTTRSVA